MRKALCIALLMALPSFAKAAPPTELEPVFRSADPYGQADFTFLWMDVYHIALWTDEPRWRPDGAYALSITYRMSFRSAELVERTCKEMQRHHPSGSEWCEGRNDMLKRVMPDVRAGDRITALRTANGHARFFKDGAPTGTIDDAAFVDAFFAIWLGENTSEPRLRQQLVGRS